MMTKQKNKIAIFIGGYLPAKKYGGPVTSIANLVEQLGDDFEFYIISNDHEFKEKERLANIKDGWNNVGKAKVLYIKEKQYNKKNFTSILSEIKADLIYLSSVFYYQMNFPAIAAANKLNIPILLAPRGELNEGALQIKTFKKNIYIELVKMFNVFKNVNFHVTSENEKESVINQLNINSNNIYYLQNIPSKIKAKETTNKNTNSLNLVFISRIVEKKNLLFLIQIINKCKGDICLDIYGPIEDKNYWEKCQNEMNNSFDNIKISYKGMIEHDELSTTLKKYDYFVLPTKSENYGHVIVEAILSETPIIISKATTPWDDINNNGGYVIDLSDENKWIELIEMLALQDNLDYQETINKLQKYKAKTLNTDNIKKEYLNVFIDLMKKKL